MPPGPFRIVPHDRFFRVYEGDELLGTEVYLKGALRIVQRFKELAPDAVIEPYQRPPRHADRVQEKRAGIYDTKEKGQMRAALTLTAPQRIAAETPSLSSRSPS